MPEIDFKTAISFSGIFISIIFDKFISLVNLIHIEKIFITREQKFYKVLTEIIFNCLFITFFLAYIVFLFYFYEKIYKLFVNNILIYFYVFCIAFLLYFSSFIIYHLYRFNKRFRNTIGKHKFFRKIYPLLNATSYLLFQLSLFILGSFIITFIIKNNKFTTLFPTHVIFLLLLYISINSIHYFSIHQARIYSYSYYKITKMGTKNGKVYVNLYLYNHNNIYLFLGSEKNYYNTNKYLILRKDDIEYYYIKREYYYWDKKISSSDK